MRIFGAGMAGLLAASMLRRWSPRVWEAQPSLPNNHAALLRFRTAEVSRVTGIPFKEVSVQKGVVIADSVQNTTSLQTSNLYGLKVTRGSRAQVRSLLDLSPVTRYIAPPDFIAQLARGIDIQYGYHITGEVELDPDDGPFISTIPLPIMAQEFLNKKLSWARALPIYTVRCRLSLPEGVELYQTLYYPEPHVDWYRASITGDELIVEYNEAPGMPLDREQVLGRVCWHFGLPERCVRDVSPVKEQRYGKLIPAGSFDLDRQDAIWNLTDKFGIYSVGRFATWRQLLLDDIVSDIKKVEQLFTMDSRYHHRMARLPYE